MGEVYLAHDTKLGRLVALKVLPAELAADRKRMQRFIQEAQTASSLNHPNIVTIYEIEQTDSMHLIAAEFIEGETLRRRTLDQRLTVADALDIVIQVASALAAAHERGIVHRDVKPENIMVRYDGVVKLLDFGLAKVMKPLATVDREAFTKELFSTAPGTVMGSLHYMSPEQARGLETDGRTDIWSLGCVLYEMITGRQPFPGTTAADVLASILKATPEPLRRYSPDAPPKLQEIAGKALAKDKDQRYQAVQDLLLDLRQLKKRLEFEAELSRTQNSVPPEQDRPKVAAQNDSDRAIPLTDLSAQRASMVGREREIDEICGELRRDRVRLLTLTGVGGTGKTVLAHAVARQLLREFSDGVFFVELGAIRQPELVASIIAQPLGVREADGKPILEAMKQHLRGKETLLVIDNFEQVLAAAPVLAELLAAAPRVKMLVTSREVLHLSLEREYMVPPLALPEQARQVSPDELKRYEAVRLFVERAREVKPNFALTPENASSVAAICARLDGLPLAIELAAARVKLLSPEAILSRLNQRLKLLTGGARDLPTRQQTMSGAVEWSYDLLSESEKQLFRRLAVFAGGFTFEAAEAVCQPVSVRGETQHGSARTRVEQQTTDVLDGITSLVDKSLLVATERQNVGVRLRMLEVVRDYALDRLEATAEAEPVRRNHAAYFVVLAENAEPHLQGAQPAEWLNRLDEEHDNLRVALAWSLAHDPATAARLGAGIRYFWDFHGYLTEGLGFAKEILSLREGVPTAARWKLLSMAGNMARFQGDHETAREFYETALNEGRAAGDLAQMAVSCRGLGGLAIERGDHAAARTFIEQSLAAAREANDRFGIARSLNMIGDLGRAAGDDDGARPFYEEALLLCRQLDNRYAIGNILNNLAAAEYGGGDYAAARSHFAEALTAAKALDGRVVGDRIGISYSLDGFAALAVERGEPEQAATLAGAAEQLRESMNYNVEPPERRFREAYLTSLRTMLKEDRFSAAYGRGRNLKLEEVVALALGDGGD
jgi:predicted ATPase/tRNA A-37 threonylcarbamoyl transferase component Bud32